MICKNVGRGQCDPCRNDKNGVVNFPDLNPIPYGTMPDVIGTSGVIYYSGGKFWRVDARELAYILSNLLPSMEITWQDIQGIALDGPDIKFVYPPNSGDPAKFSLKFDPTNTLLLVDSSISKALTQFGNDQFPSLFVNNATKYFIDKHDEGNCIVSLNSQGGFDIEYTGGQVDIASILTPTDISRTPILFTETEGGNKVQNAFNMPVFYNILGGALEAIQEPSSSSDIKIIYSAGKVIYSLKTPIPSFKDNDDFQFVLLPVVDVVYEGKPNWSIPNKYTDNAISVLDAKWTDYATTVLNPIIDKVNADVYPWLNSESFVVNIVEKDGSKYYQGTASGGSGKPSADDINALISQDDNMTTLVSNEKIAFLPNLKHVIDYTDKKVQEVTMMWDDYVRNTLDPVITNVKNNLFPWTNSATLVVNKVKLGDTVYYQGTVSAGGSLTPEAFIAFVDPRESNVSVAKISDNTISLNANVSELTPDELVNIVNKSTSNVTITKYDDNTVTIEAEMYELTADEFMRIVSAKDSNVIVTKIDDYTIAINSQPGELTPDEFIAFVDPSKSNVIITKISETTIAINSQPGELTPDEFIAFVDPSKSNVIITKISETTIAINASSGGLTPDALVNIVDKGTSNVTVTKHDSSTVTIIAPTSEGLTPEALVNIVDKNTSNVTVTKHDDNTVSINSPTSEGLTPDVFLAFVDASKSNVVVKKESDSTISLTALDTSLTPDELVAIVDKDTSNVTVTKHDDNTVSINSPTSEGLTPEAFIAFVDESKSNVVVKKESDSAISLTALDTSLTPDELVVIVNKETSNVVITKHDDNTVSINAPTSEGLTPEAFIAFVDLDKSNVDVIKVSNETISLVAVNDQIEPSALVNAIAAPPISNITVVAYDEETVAMNYKLTPETLVSMVDTGTSNITVVKHDDNTVSVNSPGLTADTFLAAINQETSNVVVTKHDDNTVSINSPTTGGLTPDEFIAFVDQTASDVTITKLTPGTVSINITEQTAESGYLPFFSPKLRPGPDGATAPNNYKVYYLNNPNQPQDIFGTGDYGLSGKYLISTFLVRITGPFLSNSQANSMASVLPKPLPTVFTTTTLTIDNEIKLPTSYHYVDRIYVALPYVSLGFEEKLTDPSKDLVVLDCRGLTYNTKIIIDHRVTVMSALTQLTDKDFDGKCDKIANGGSFVYSDVSIRVKSGENKLLTDVMFLRNNGRAFARNVRMNGSAEEIYNMEAVKILQHPKIVIASNGTDWVTCSEGEDIDFSRLVPYYLSNAPDAISVTDVALNGKIMFLSDLSLLKKITNVTAYPTTSYHFKLRLMNLDYNNRTSAIVVPIDFLDENPSDIRTDSIFRSDYNVTTFVISFGDEYFADIDVSFDAEKQIFRMSSANEISRDKNLQLKYNTHILDSIGRGSPLTRIFPNFARFSEMKYYPQDNLLSGNKSWYNLIDYCSAESSIDLVFNDNDLNNKTSNNRLVFNTNEKCIDVFLPFDFDDTETSTIWRNSGIRRINIYIHFSSYVLTSEYADCWGTIRFRDFRLDSDSLLFDRRIYYTDSTQNAIDDEGRARKDTIDFLAGNGESIYSFGVRNQNALRYRLFPPYNCGIEIKGGIVIPVNLTGMPMFI